MENGGPEPPVDYGKLPRHKAHTAKSSRLQLVLNLLLVVFFVGTIYAGYAAYHTSYVELKLIGNKTFNFSETEGEFKEPGYLAHHCVFSHCHDLSDNVIVENPNLDDIKNHVVGDYEISYTLNYLGETHTDSREIIIRDITPPKLTLNGPETSGLYIGQAFEEPGFSAEDTHDGDLTTSVVVEGGVDTSHFGVYTLTYKVADAAGNSTEASRRVFVYNYAAFTSEPIATFDELRDYIVRNGWDISFGFKNFEKNIEYTFQPDKPYYGASLIKTIDAMYIYDHFGGPRTVGERSLITNAITYSNNSAHTALVSSLGINNLRDYADSIGMAHHLRGSVYYSDLEYFSDTTVADQLAEWSKLYELINNPTYGEDLKHYFTNNYWDNLSFPSSPTHMYKNGLYGNNYHESGIMFSSSPFFMTFLSTEGWRWNMTYIMQDLAERAYLINEAL